MLNKTLLMLGTLFILAVLIDHGFASEYPRELQNAVYGASGVLGPTVWGVIAKFIYVKC